MTINQNIRSFPKPSLVSADVPPPIPAFPAFAPFALGHKKIFDEAFGRVNPRNSEFCFGYLFSWQRPLALEASLFGGNILIRGNLAGADFIFPPIPSDEDTSAAASEAAARAAVEALAALKEKKLSSAPRIICASEKLADAVRAFTWWDNGQYGTGRVGIIDTGIDAG
ncbi:MAG: hypothetical protein QME32_03270, partial [Endomicrobiia bacterium]|nr:hypothetical protein [Endomicrobiia bacterium]